MIFDHELVIIRAGRVLTFCLFALKALIERLVELATIPATETFGLAPALFGTGFLALVLAVKFVHRKVAAGGHGLSQRKAWEAKRSTNHCNSDTVSHDYLS
jgi:hypothetical protein